MRLIPVLAAFALVLATPALAQQSTTPAPAAGNTQKAQADKAKADKAKAEKAKPAKDAKAAKENERSNKGGATRGDERAGQVKDMNNQRKTN
jgi:hypothetical protein